MYTVVKTIKGRTYRHLQRTWREGKRVRTESIYLGPLDGRAGPAPDRKRKGIAAFLHAQRLSPEDRALATAEKRTAEIDQYQRETFGETAIERKEREEREHLERLYDLYGLKLGPANPTPIEPSRAPEAPTATTSTGQSGNEVSGAESDAGSQANEAEVDAAGGQGAAAEPSTG